MARKVRCSKSIAHLHTAGHTSPECENVGNVCTLSNFLGKIAGKRYKRSSMLGQIVLNTRFLLAGACYYVRSLSK